MGLFAPINCLMNGQTRVITLLAEDSNSICNWIRGPPCTCFRELVEPSVTWIFRCYFPLPFIKMIPLKWWLMDWMIRNSRSKKHHHRRCYNKVCLKLLRMEGFPGWMEKVAGGNLIIHLVMLPNNKNAWFNQINDILASAFVFCFPGGRKAGLVFVPFPCAKKKSCWRVFYFCCYW